MAHDSVSLLSWLRDPHLRGMGRDTELLPWLVYNSPAQRQAAVWESETCLKPRGQILRAPRPHHPVVSMVVNSLLYVAAFLNIAWLIMSQWNSVSFGGTCFDFSCISPDTVKALGDILGITTAHFYIQKAAQLVHMLKVPCSSSSLLLLRGSHKH